MDALGVAGHGLAGTTWHGLVWFVPSRRGVSRQASPVGASRGSAWPGTSRYGEAWLGRQAARS